MNTNDRSCGSGPLVRLGEYSGRELIHRYCRIGSPEPREETKKVAKTPILLGTSAEPGAIIRGAPTGNPRPLPLEAGDRCFPHLWKASVDK